MTVPDARKEWKKEGIMARRGVSPVMPYMQDSKVQRKGGLSPNGAFSLYERIHGADCVSNVASVVVSSRCRPLLRK